MQRGVIGELADLGIGSGTDLREDAGQPEMRNGEFVAERGENGVRNFGKFPDAVLSDRAIEFAPRVCVREKTRK